MKKLVEIAKENNLQLFFTSHNYGVISALLACCDPEDLHCYHVIRDSKKGKVSANIEPDIQKILDDLYENQERIKKNA